MRVRDAALHEVRDQGFTVVEGFLSPAEVRTVRRALTREFPSADEFHADPAAHAELVATPFAGNRPFPFPTTAIALLACHRDLVDAAERFLSSTDLALYKIELWAKYSGTCVYQQGLHRDFGNHNLLVPRADGRWPQMTTFLLLSDVTIDDGPTYVVPRRHSATVPLSVRHDDGAHGLADHEVPVVGPAGTLLIYTTDVFHRGSSMTGHRRARFTLLADYMARDAPWLGKRAWPDSALQPGWDALLAACSPRQRELFGVPPPGHPYWNAQTVADVAARWPGVDMTPYAPRPRRRTRTGRAAKVRS